MSLYSTIQKRMKNDLESLQASLAGKHAEVEAELRMKLNAEDRMYKEMVDDVIAQRVNSETYKLKQDAYFGMVQSSSDAIEQAYRNLLPKLLEHKIFAEQVQQFLSGADSTTTVTVSGQYAQECKAAIEAAGHKQVEVADSEGLGRMAYVIESRSAELSLEDFLADVKKRTIQYVSAATKNV